ncbi:MAG: peptidoglycan DD-metalloendopeptidase family protein [Firmicutes bacterium]|nr:peptidoglycan DD-metalloendopeptidase family protein [Bacillota bacterium]
MPQQKRVIMLTAIVILVLASLPGLKIIAEALRKETAYQFVVDGKVWFAVSKKVSLEEILDEYKKQYLKNIDKHAMVKKVDFLQKIEIVEVKIKPDYIDELKVAKEKISAVEEEAVIIEVKKGDNLWNLAKAHDLTVSELEILNPDADPHKIFPGDKLVVKPVNPALDVIVEFENTVMESIPFKNEYKKVNNLFKNQQKILKKGVEGEKEVTYYITLHNGYQKSLAITNENILKEPVNALVQIGTRTTVFRGGRINYGVVHGKRISSLYGNRIHPITGKRRFHEGLDIAANHGNGVHAYTDGRVVEAGWNGGYGNCILVDHGNGLRTRYGHLSKISVRVGQRVKTGERIGAVGSTGTSTGPHLHFEVIRWGRTQNPLNYL